MSGADKGKQKLEEGIAADKNQEEEAVPSSRGEPTRYSAADEGKEMIEEGTAAAKQKAERDALLERSELDRRRVADNRIEEREAASHARQPTNPAEGFSEIQGFSPEVCDHKHYAITAVALVVLFMLVFLVVYKPHPVKTFGEVVGSHPDKI